MNFKIGDRVVVDVSDDLIHFPISKWNGVTGTITRFDLFKDFVYFKVDGHCRLSDGTPVYTAHKSGDAGFAPKNLRLINPPKSPKKAVAMSNYANIDAYGLF